MPDTNPKIKLLIADDQELILESLNIVLGMEEDISVVGLAKDGEVAVQFCERYTPDIVLMDIHMPILDGVNATKIIKERFPDIKIIILTSYKEVDYVLNALGNGAEGFLLKAIHPKNLVAGIRVVHTGGTLISQEMAGDMIQRMKATEPGTASEASEVPSVQAKVFGLSKRELEVLQKLALGLRNQEIAEALFLGEGTVKNYISNIYAKLNAKGRLDATRKARDAGIIGLQNGM